MKISFLDNREATLAGEVVEALDHCEEAHVAVAFARQSAREVLGEPLDRYVREGKKLRSPTGTDFHLTELDGSMRPENP